MNSLKCLIVRELCNYLYKNVHSSIDYLEIFLCPLTKHPVYSNLENLNFSSFFANPNTCIQLADQLNQPNLTSVGTMRRNRPEIIPRILHTQRADVFRSIYHRTQPTSKKDYEDKASLVNVQIVPLVETAAVGTDVCTHCSLSW